MLNKKSVKIVSILMLAVVLLMSVGAPVFALINPSPEAPGGEATAIAQKILNALMWIGIVVAVGMMIFLGIKYVTSSPDGKADIKGKLGVYVLGLALILSSSGIVAAIASALGKSV